MRDPKQQTPGPSLVPVAWVERLPSGAAAGAGLIASLALAGWALGAPALRGVLPGLVAMNPLTAVAFLLTALALRLHARRGAAPATAMLGAAVALLGALRLAEYLGGWSMGLDQILFRAQLDAMDPPNRMAPNTAAGFLQLGVAVACLRIPARRWHPTPILALLVTVLALVAITGYGYRAPEFFRVGSFIPMALNTAAAFLLLGLGLLVAGPRPHFVAVIASGTTAGATARLLLAAAVAVPIGIGWLRLLGERAGLYTPSTGTVLFAISTVVLFAGLVARTAIGAQAAYEAEAMAAKALRASEQRLTQILDSLPVGVFVVDAGGRAWLVNRAAAEILGKGLVRGAKPGELPETYRAYVAGTDQVYPAERQPIALALGGQRAYAADIEIRRPDRTVPIEVWAAPVYDEDGHLTHSVAALHDITERRRTRRQIETLNDELERQVAELQVVNRELETFSYSVSHDLRAPLRAIDGFARILEDDHGAALDTEARRVLGVVRENAVRMGRLIDDLLQFSRLSRKELEAGPVDMTALATAVLGEARRGAAGKSAEVRVGTLPPAWGDAALLRQVWANLLGNALKFSRTRDQPRVEVRGHAEGAEAVYAVADNGVGFDPSFADRLFAVFHRLHRDDEFEGTGVGLAIVQRVVHRHGGRVWGEGRPGAGATFHFTLPRGAGGGAAE